MRLAKHQAVLADDANRQRVADLKRNDKLSIRSALKLIPKTPRRSPTSGRDPSAKEKSQRAGNASQASVTIDNLLENMDADEVFSALRDTFDMHQLATLNDLIANFLDEHETSTGSIQHEIAAV